MYRHRVLWFMIGLLILAALACQAFQQEAEPTAAPAPTLGVGEVPTANGATADATLEGLEPTITLPGSEATPATGDSPTVTVLVDLNVRRGPGTLYDIVAFLPQGTSVPITGVDPASGWWKIRCPPATDSSECWISGGSRFSRAENAAGVPVAAVPPTPTAPPVTATVAPTETAPPAATTAAPDAPIIVYIENGDAWVRPLSVSGSSVSAGAATRLTNIGDVNDVFISPNGRYVAYQGGEHEANYLGLVNVDGSDNRQLLRSTDLPDPGADLLPRIGQIQWLAGSQRMVFNTMVVAAEGPGIISNEDLWTVTIGNERTQRLAAGQGGGAFAVSPTFKVVTSSNNEVIRSNLDGSEREVVISFPMINTASEYIYYPQPQWMADGSRSLLAIPDPDPFSFEGPDPPQATLWEVPASGPAVELGTVTGNLLFDQPAWSASGARLAFVQSLPSPGNAPKLFLATGSGATPTAVGPEGQTQFFEWHSNEFNYLYATETGHAVGIVGSVDIQIPAPAGQAVIDGQWVTGVTYVYLQGSTSSWNYNFGDLSGSTGALFAAAGGSVPAFDVWTP